jgi:hypothetical protein
MKTKILTYKNEFTGELYFKNVILLPTDDANIFYFEIKDDLPNAVFLIGDLYFNMGYFNPHNYIHVDEYKERVKNAYLNFRENTIKLPRPSTLNIEVFRILGWEYQLLIDKREAYISNKNAEELRERQEKERKNEEADQKQRQLILKNIEYLKQGDRITFNELVGIIRHLKLNVHIRTIGAISKLGDNWISKDQGLFNKNTSQGTVNSIFEVIKLITV